MQRRATALRLVAFLLLVGGAGCSVYVPASLTEVTPGSSIRVRVDPAVALRAQEFTRAIEDEFLDGSLVEMTRDSIVVALWRTDLMATRSLRAGTVRVPLQHDEVLESYTRQISRSRTGLLAAAVIGGAFVLARELFGGSSGGVSGGAGGGAQIIMIPGTPGP